MDFDIISGGVKKAFDTFVQDIVVYIVGALIFAFGSCLIITSAPLLYGLYYMVLKGTRGEKVEIKDVLYGFSSGSIFVRSWIGAIGMAIVPIIVVIVLMIPIFILPSLSFIFILIMWVAMLVIGIFLFYSPYIYVMTPSENIVYAIKESISIGKSNILMVLVTIIVTGILSMFYVTMPLGSLFAVYVLKELNPEIKDDSGM